MKITRLSLTWKTFLWVMLGFGLIAWAVREFQAPLSGLASSSWHGTAQAQYPYKLHIPFIARRSPLLTPFGVEPMGGKFTAGDLLQPVQDLGIGWVRLGSLRVSWRQLQPVEGGPIDWGSTAEFETELRGLRAAGIDPVVIIYDNPLWAVVNARDDGQLTTCAAVKQDKLDDYAAFVSQVVARYSTGGFGVHHWELGNEVDADPNEVPVNSGFGCWGEMDDPYYGGRYYGEMLRIVTPVIRAQDPNAKVWLGGLLLAQPDSVPKPGKVGRSELFLEGVLLAGAGSYFDVVTYHWHPAYYRYIPCTGCPLEKYDYDLGEYWHWNGWGGGSKGKALFLKQVLAQYGYVKKIAFDETGLGCEVAWEPTCTSSLPETFLQAQSDYLVRSAMRALSAGVSWYSWYTIDSPSWRYSALLDEYDQPKPVYYTYRFLIQLYQDAIFKGEVYYGSGTEGYAFERESDIVHVVWAVNDEPLQIQIPEGWLLAIYTRDGDGIALPSPVNGAYHLNVYFSPTYFVLKP